VSLSPRAAAAIGILTIRQSPVTIHSRKLSEFTSS
jgi:hypothetical protein